MSPLDATFLHVEDGVTHMHIGSVSVFEGPAPPYEDLVELFRTKVPLVPRYRQKVRFVPAALGRPVWVDDPHFRLDYHVRHTALPPPGDADALRSLVGRLMSQELDRHRPLWEAWMVEGLHSGHWALISKVHHCMVDGVSGTDLISVILDHERVPAPPEATNDWHPGPEPTRADLVRHALTQTLSSPVEMNRWMRGAVQRPAALLAQLGAVAKGARSLGGQLRPNTPLSIEGSIGPHRRWTWASTTIDDIKVVRSGLGGTVNDVVLAAITRGYRALLLSRGEDVEGQVLHTLVPVSMRAPGDRTHNNQVAAIIAALPIGIEDPVACLQAIKEQMDGLKGSHQIEASAALFNLADVAPPMLFAATLRGLTAVFNRMPQRSVNTVTTNVPGPPDALYACGREMLEYLPYVPLAQGLRTGVAILSYNRKITFGLTGDWDTAPDLDVLARAITAAIVELQEHARARATAAAATKATQVTPADQQPVRALSGTARRRRANGGARR